MTILGTVFLKGIVFGITMAVIPGPIFFLIVQRTLANGLMNGMLSGLGAIMADMAYALTAAVGLTFVMQFLMGYKAFIAIAGGAFLIYLGITTFRAEPEMRAANVQSTTLFHAWFSTFILTLANPVTVVMYGLMFAGLSADATDESLSAALTLAGGVFVGTLVVVGALVLIVASFRQKLSRTALQIINKTAGVLLAGFGILAIAKGIAGLQ